MDLLSIDYFSPSMVWGLLNNSPLAIKSARVEMVRKGLPYPHDERGKGEVLREYCGECVFPGRRVVTLNDAPGEQGRLFSIVTESLWASRFQDVPKGLGQALAEQVGNSVPYSLVYEITSVAPLQEDTIDQMKGWIHTYMDAGEYEFYEGQGRWATGGLAMFSAPLKKSEITLEGLSGDEQSMVRRWAYRSLRHELEPERIRELTSST